MTFEVKPPTNAQRVADYFVWRSQEHGDPITNLKLQKLLYYAQGWHLALHHRPLFRDTLQAWPRGPAVYGVWKTYSDYKWKPISKRVKLPPIYTGTKAFLDSVFDVFGKHTAYTLERATHREPPWRKAREGLGERERSNIPISLDEMKKYFSSLAHGAR